MTQTQAQLNVGQNGGHDSPPLLDEKIYEALKLPW